MKYWPYANILGVAIVLAISSCAHDKPQQVIAPISPAKIALVSPDIVACEPHKQTQKPSPERYLDRMAIEDAHRNSAQSPDPSYVLDADSVVHIPNGGHIDIIFIGDSILTGWSGYFSHVFPKAFLDGRVGRQFSSAIPIWEALEQTHVADRVGFVVLELGTNGEVSLSDMSTFLKLVGRRQVFLVMPQMPRAWEREVQDLYQQTAAAHSNVHLVYWNRLSQDRPDYFWSDRVHPNWKGVQVMVGAIADALEQVNSSLLAHSKE